MKIKHIFVTLIFITTIGTTLFAQSISVKENKNIIENMTNPETLVKSFIQDYFLWNTESFKQANKIDLVEKSALLALGIKESSINLEETKMSKYVEIKGRTSAEYAKLLPQIDSEYQKLIEKYCRPNYKRLNTAFGGESAHDPNNEVIVSVKTIDGKSIVKTRHTNKIGAGEFISDYEFHLTYENERWYLEQIFYVDDEGRYEGL